MQSSPMPGMNVPVEMVDGSFECKTVPPRLTFRTVRSRSPALFTKATDTEETANSLATLKVYGASPTATVHCATSSSFMTSDITSEPVLPAAVTTIWSGRAASAGDCTVASDRAPASTAMAKPKPTRRDQEDKERRDLPSSVSADFVSDALCDLFMTNITIQ